MKNRAARAGNDSVAVISGMDVFFHKVIQILNFVKICEINNSLLFNTFDNLAHISEIDKGFGYAILKLVSNMPFRRPFLSADSGVWAKSKTERQVFPPRRKNNN